MVKKHFVFDLDDTLINGRQFCGESMARVITTCEKHVSFAEIVAYHNKVHGRTIVDLYQGAIEEFHLTTPLDKLVHLDGKIQMNEFSRIQTFEGVIEILDFLKTSGKTIHICTNRKSESLLPILKHTNIFPYFDNIVSCIDKGSKKPDPACLFDIIKQTGDDKDSFIYFGDSVIDSEFAKNAGIDFIIFDQYLNEQNLFAKLINMFLENKIPQRHTQQKSTHIRKAKANLHVHKQKAS